MSKILIVIIYIVEYKTTKRYRTNAIVYLSSSIQFVIIKRLLKQDLLQEHIKSE
jgi:hypothetical protein